MISNVVLVGNIQDYQSNFNLINSQIKNESMRVMGILLEQSYFESIDDIPVYNSFSQIKNLNFDYFILLTDNKDYKKQISEKFDFKQKIIPIRVFSIPYFNFDKYKQLLENPPSIISRHCWGGLLYHRLGLQFKSPFINLFLKDIDFNKLVKNFSHYMNQELKYIEDGYDPILKSNYPIVKLDDITIYFNHYSTFEEAKNKWEERKKRINYDNLFFETSTEDIEVALEFDSIEVENKLCFCMDEINSNEMINCRQIFSNFQPGKLGMFVNGTVTGDIPLFNLIDLLLSHDLKPRMKIPKMNSELAYKHYKNTKVYDLEHYRFSGKDDTVNWELDDKIVAYDYVEKFNVKHPKILYKLNDIKELRNLAKEENLPKNFVLKISNQASCIGVMILRYLENEKYFDELTSKAYTLDEIILKQSDINKNITHKIRETYYFIEELVDNFVENIFIPIDYKVFCFNGVPKFILQVNRNKNHYTISLFDGNFIPLKEGRDWFADEKVAEVGIPIIPPSAYEMLEQSIQIAKEVKDKMIRIDWFDNGKEPIFGEFTFITGATFTGMFAFSEEILTNLDTSLEREFFKDFNQKGYEVNSLELHETFGIELDFKTPEYFTLLKKCVLGNMDALENMVNYFEKLAYDETDVKKMKLYQHLEIIWLEILLIYEKLRSEKLCKQIHAKWGFISNKTPYYKQRIIESKDALYNMSKDNDWYKLRWAHFILIFGGNESEIKKSREYVELFSLKKSPYALQIKKMYNL